MSIVRNLGVALLLWLQGMVVGTVVFSVPALAALGPIPLVSANPVITACMLVLWPLTMWRFARGRPRPEAVRIGLVCVAVNVTLDLAVMVGVMKAPGFHGYAGLWLAYASLLLVPWAVAAAPNERLPLPS